MHPLASATRVVAAAALLLCLSSLPAFPRLALADSAPYCAPDQTLDWLPALAPLGDQLGDTMGSPTECPHPAGDSDDTVQQTTTGLAMLRATSGAPTFTDGTTRWALTASGVISWTGAGLDPPGPAMPCARQAVRGFGVVFGSQPEAYDLLGCPSFGEAGLDVVVQRFEHGWMLWQAKRDSVPATIYALFEDNQHYARFDDTYSATGDPLVGQATPPPGLLQPSGGFGKVWRAGAAADVKNRLGWATAPESPGAGALESFQRGSMVFTPDPREVFVLAATTADRPSQVLQVWRVYVDTFSN